MSHAGYQAEQRQFVASNDQTLIVALRETAKRTARKPRARALTKKKSKPTPAPAAKPVKAAPPAAPRVEPKKKKPRAPIFDNL